MLNTRRLAALSLLMLTTVALLAVPVTRAGADPAPPAGYAAGTGNFEGTETFQDEQFLGIPCFKTTRSVFGLQGVGTYEGVTPGGQPVVYKAEIASGQTLYGNGPLHIEVENTQLYYHGPKGTAGPTDTTCATNGIPVTAEFRIWATDHVYRLDGANVQVPCVGHGTFTRGPQGEDWNAQWTLDSDCTVVGNAAGTPGTGLSRVGTGFTNSGNHGPCFDTCVNNIKFNYTQYLPFVGLHLGVSGPGPTKVNTTADVFAHLTDDGAAVADAPVSFAVSGPGPTAPSTGDATTAADGSAPFSFTTATVGTYTVTATTPSTTNPGETITATQTVQFVPPTPPTVKLWGPAAAQTEEAVYVAATFTNDDVPTQGVPVSFSVTGSGMVTPASGTVTTNQDGKALFSFAGDKAGNYSVTASATYLSQSTTDTLTIALEINTFYRKATLGGVGGLAVIDPAGDYAYFASTSLAKVDLHTFQQVGSIPLSSTGPAAAVIDPAGHYAYFTNGSTATQITKVDLTAFQVVGTLTLATDERSTRSAVIDPAGHFAYFGASAQNTLDPGKVVKVDLDTFQRVGVLAFPSDEDNPAAALMSPAGDYAYFGAQGGGSEPARLVKVDLATFQRVGSLPMADATENMITGGSVIDPVGHYAYLPVHQAALGSASNPEHIVKVDLTTFSRVASITLERGTPYFNNPETRLAVGVMEPAGNFAYFGMNASGGSPSAGYDERILRIDLRTFEEDLPITVKDTTRGFGSAVIAPDGKFAYFQGFSAGVMKIALNRPPNPALAAAGDTYATNYLTPLTVSAPGVLANDVNNANNDPLVAGQASDPAGGSVTLNPDGSFTYTPDVGFSGTDTFTYTASDLRDYSAPVTVSVNVGAPPLGVSAVGGGACGYYTNVGLFGGPQSLLGCGQTVNDASATSPSVTLAPTGSAGPITATKAEGAIGRYGPAAIFSGIWPANASAPPQSGPLSVSTQGTTGPGGSVTSSAHAVLRATPLPVRCYGDPVGTTNCSAPGGIGPGPLIADQAHSTCTANESGLSGSASFVNGKFEAKYDIDTQLPIVVKDVPANPPPNYTLDGTLDHVGDSFRVVFNEQILTNDSITVNAAHMYLIGPTAIGDMVVAQSRCAISTNAPDASPTAAGDSYTAGAGHRLVVPAAGLLANDSDADFGPLRASPQLAIAPPASGGGEWTFPSDPAHGTLSLGADGSFVYTPDSGYTGADSFTYVAQDSRGRSSAPAAVAVNVVDLGNTAPVANNDTYSVVTGTALNIAAPGVLGNDTDADNDLLTAGSASVPAHGSVTLNANGAFAYTSVAGYVGPDSFTYLADDGNGAGSVATVALTVTPVPGPPTLSVNDVVVAEGNSGNTTATFTITRGGNTSGTTTVKYRTVNVTATAGSDYSAIALSTVTFGPGQVTATVAVAVTGDGLFEKNETFKLLLSSPSKGATLSDGTGVGTIVNDDPAALLSVNDISVTEGNSGTTNATFTVTRSGNTTGAATVKVRTTDGTATAASGDYVALPLQTITFADGQATATVVVLVNGDTTLEKNQTFKLALSAPVGATIADPAGLATIVNDD
jgi:hypothetical protein